MGHDLHFLGRLERLRDDQVSQALSFYRDDDLVKSVLKELKLPEAIDRVAISLDDPVEGPFIIVHRSGRFITCLGEGMHVGDCHVVSKERFDNVTKDIVRVREILAEVTANPRHEMKKLHEKLLQRGDQISREQFEQIKEWYPLTRVDVVRTFFSVSLEFSEVSRRLRRRIVDFKKKDEANLRLFYQHAWALAHLSLLMGSDSGAYVRKMLADPDCPQSMYVMAYQSLNSCVSSLTARGAWLAGKIGKPMISHAKRTYKDPVDTLDLVYSGLALTSIGLLHRKYRAEISKVLSQNSEMCGEDKYKRVFQALRKLTANYFEFGCENPRELAPFLPRFGTDFMRDFGKDLPAGHALSFGPDNPLSDDLACSFAMQVPLDMMRDKSQVLVWFLGWMPRIAHASCSDFFLPEKYMECMRGEWTPRHTLTLLKPMLDYDQLGDRPLATPKSPPKPERNAPCPCGSQKKYKRCCALTSSSERPVTTED